MASLAEYVAQMRDRGYSAADLRSSLLAQGYTSAEVDAALASAFGRGLSVRTLWAVAAVILIAVAGLAVWFLREPSRPLDVSVSLERKEVAPGERLPVESRVVSPRRADVRLVAEIISPDGGLQAVKGLTLTDAVEESVRLELDVPERIVPGVYSVRVTAKSGGEQVRDVVSFDVRPPVQALPEPEAPPSEPVPVPETSIPEEPVQVPSEPEPPESQPSPAAPEFTLDDIKAIALEDADRAVRLCRDRADSRGRDACFTTVALSSNQTGLCQSVEDITQRDSCYAGFAINGEYSVCELITRSDWRKSCEALKKFNEENP